MSPSSPLQLHKSKLGLAVLVAGSYCLSPSAFAADAQIAIVGSSTVYPFTTVIAELFGKATETKIPKVEATGTGGGMKLLCSGVGDQHPDIANASRAIKSSEVELCASNGISAPLEVKIGYDGIVVAHSADTDPLAVTRTQLFLALARQLPDASGVLQPNSNVNWSDIDPALPAIAIQVYGPPPTSGTRDAFVELALAEGCAEVAGMQELKSTDESRYDAVCTSIREDGAFIEAGENDNLIIQRLVSNPDAVGIFGFSFLEENLDKVTGVLIDGVAPEFEAIEDRSYPLARPLFIYVKTEHAELKSSLLEFVEFYVSEDVIGPDGYLEDRGLVPLPAAERDLMRAAVSSVN